MEKFSVTKLIDASRKASKQIDEYIKLNEKFARNVYNFANSGSWSGDDALQWFGVTFRFSANNYIRIAMYAKQWALCLSAAQDNLNKQKTYNGKYDQDLKKIYNDLYHLTSDAVSKAKSLENGKV